MPLIAYEPKRTQEIRQAAAVPFRHENERLEFCLITSSAGRWTFPKGVIDKGDGYGETALKEAYEEAGLHGHIVGSPMGCYPIRKNGRRVHVVAMLMSVSKTDKTWQEQARRHREWVAPERAGDLFGHGDLANLLDIAVERLSGIGHSSIL